MMPKGMYHNFVFKDPGNAIMKIENTPNNLRPLQGSPIHTP